MINKRIIFALLYSRGFFYLSRNFRLQKVGDLNWLEKNYSFHETCQYIDELAFILVTQNPNKEEIKKFYSDVGSIRKKIFAPIIIGGGIRNIRDVKNCFDNGADKILINTESQNIDLINEVSENYGNQAISLMIDYKYDDDKKRNNNIFLNCGTEKKSVGVNGLLKKLKKQKFGEIILHSMDRDGTGNGYDLDIIKTLPNMSEKPLLLMGGAGKPMHIVTALKNTYISGVITANLFNFIGDGLKITREMAKKEKIKIAQLT